MSSSLPVITVACMLAALKSGLFTTYDSTLSICAALECVLLRSCLAPGRSCTPCAVAVATVSVFTHHGSERVVGGHHSVGAMKRALLYSPGAIWYFMCAQALLLYSLGQKGAFHTRIWTASHNKTHSPLGVSKVTLTLNADTWTLGTSTELNALNETK